MSRGWGGVAAVSAVALLGGWAGVAVNQRLGRPHQVDSPGSGIWVASPLAATTLVRLLDRDSAPGWWGPRAHPGWYAVATAAFPVVNGIVLGAGRAAGRVDTSGWDGRRLATAAVAAIGPGAVKNVLEEAVWRGYLTSELVERRVPDVGIYLVTGVVWGLWHLPYYLFLLPEETMREILDVPRPVFAAAAVGVMLAWAVPFAELFRLSGSVWPCVLMHTVEDALNPMLLDGHVRIDGGSKAVLSPVMGVLPAVVHLGLGLGLRALRRRRGRFDRTS